MGNICDVDGIWTVSVGRELDGIDVENDYSGSR